MVYIWSINNPEDNHVVSGNQVTIQKSNKGNQGASFTCVVKEQGSSLTGSDTVTLNVLCEYFPFRSLMTISNCTMFTNYKLWGTRADNLSLCHEVVLRTYYVMEVARLR